MNRFPVRGQLTADEYRAQSRTSEYWELLDKIANHQVRMVFPPGSVHFFFVGFLIVLIGSGVASFVNFSLLATSSLATKGYFLFGTITLSVLVHCGFMLPVNLGFIYAQQYLVNYLTTLFSLISGVGVYGIYEIAIGDIQPSDFLPLFMSLSAALAMLLLSRSAGFSVYAEIMRVKRVYLQDIRKPITSV